MSDHFQFWISIHAVLMTVAWGILIPGGVYAARYWRQRVWFPIHRALMITGSVASFVGSGIAFYACESHFNKPHKMVGPLLNSLLIAQMITGSIAHANRDPTRTTKPSLNTAHVMLGYGTLLGGWLNMILGVIDLAASIKVKIICSLLYAMIIGSVIYVGESSSSASD